VGAFVAPGSSISVLGSTTSTNLQALSSPINGGVEGSSNLPGAYGRVNVMNPYGGKEPFRPTSQRAVNDYSKDSQLKGVADRGPVNGGTNGSSSLPGQYGQVSVHNPYGGTQEYLRTSGNRAMNDASGSAEKYISGPVNGGLNGSSKVPSQYGKVNVMDPYGSSRLSAAPTGGNRAVSDFSGQIKGVKNGPGNGGLNGSSLLPSTYETVSRDIPWGGKNKKTTDYYNPQTATQIAKQGLLPASPTASQGKSSGFASGATGGAEGSSRIVDRGIVGREAPWGNQRY